MKQKIVAAGGLVLNEHNELLMIFRRGFWDLPKGKQDKGETIETCAVREVQEETGLQKIKLVKPAGITLHDYFDKHLEKDVVKETHWFVMKATAGEQLIAQTEEDITEIKWVPANEVKKYMALSYKNIEEIVTKAGIIQGM